jgi:hypothetical protein
MKQLQGAFPDHNSDMKAYINEFDRRNGLKHAPIEFGPAKYCPFCGGRDGVHDSMCGLDRILCRSEK